jgi:hypothetical protein
MMSMKTKSLNTSALVTADSPKGQRATETFRAQYNKAGLTEESAQVLNENPGFAAYLLTGIKRFSMKAPDYELVRTILGKDFISPEEIMKSRKGVNYTEEQLVQFGETVPAQEILEWCRDNSYMFVAGPNRPMSLLEIRTMKNGYFYSKEGGWYAYKNMKFSQKDKVETKWYMIRKNPVPESTSKNWEEQQSLISDVETVPNATEFTWAITTYKAVRDVYLFGGIYVRTSSLVSDGNHVVVGFFDDKGLDVYYDWDSSRNSILGLSVARK